MSHVIAAGSRIGLIVEGDPDGAVVTDWITRLLRPDLRLLETDQRRLAPKPILIRRAPAVADTLIESGCPAHKVKIGRMKRPELLANPKKELSRIFQIKGKRTAYVDFLEAGPLAQKVKDIGRLQRLGSFKELMANVGVDGT